MTFVPHRLWLWLCVRRRYRPHTTCCPSCKILGELRDRFALTAQPCAPQAHRDCEQGWRAESTATVFAAAGAPLGKHTHHPVRVHEVINRRALPQKLGIGHHVKAVGHTPAGQFLGYPEPHLAGRTYGYGTLVHYYPVAIHGLAYAPGRGLYMVARVASQDGEKLSLGMPDCLIIEAKVPVFNS